MAPKAKKDKIKLSVVIYKPDEGNHHHWAFYVYNEKDKTHTIYEVVGSSPNFRKNVLNVNPRNTRRFVKEILLDRIDRQDLDELKEGIEAAEVDNETTEWNCQDYVIGFVDKLEEEAVLDTEDQDYQAAREEVMDMFGPIDEDDE